MLINFQNGTYDLEVEQLLPHNSADNFLSCLPFSYDPSVECPRWLGFLNDVFSKDAEIYQSDPTVCWMAPSSRAGRPMTNI